MPKYRVLSVKSGNPITIQDEDIGITWPAALVCDINILSRRPKLIFSPRMDQLPIHGRQLS